MNKLIQSNIFKQRSKGMGPLLTSETSNYQLMDLAKRLDIKLDAICYIDQLNCVPCSRGTKSNYIINLREPAHWVALYICNYNHKKIGFYFNSYSAIMPVPKEVINFLNRCGCNMYYDSNKSVQLSSQGHCGQFAIDFLCYMNKSGNPVINYERFLSHLHNTNIENIKYVIRQLS